MAVAPNEPAAPPAPPPAAPPAPASPPPAAPPASGLGNLPPAPAPVDPNAPPADPNAGKLIVKDRPAWLPETFYDPKTGEVKVEALAQNAADLKAKLSTGTHKPPATAEGYAIDFSKEADPGVKAAAAAIIVTGEDGSPDPVLAAVQADCFKEGVSVHAFNTVLRSYLKNLAPTLPPPMDEQAELAKLGHMGPAMLKNLNTFADEQLKHGKWTDGERQKFRDYLYDAEDARFLQKLLFDAGLVPEIQVAHLQQQSATEDMITLDKELSDLQARAAKGENVQAAFDANLAKREKLLGDQPQRSWPIPA